MKISELIAILSGAISEHGDLDCFCNGEHGIGEIEIMKSDNVSIGPAGLSFDTDYLKISDEDNVCHIGGY
jgi:hypothetical protein